MIELVAMVTLGTISTRFVRPS